MGTTTPKHYGAFINRISYKDLTLIINTDFKFGHKFRTFTMDYENFLIDGTNYVHENWTKRCIQAGGQNKTDILIPTYI